MAIPALLFIVAGAAFEISDEWRRASERQAYRERMAEERAYIEKVCGSEPKGKEPWMDYAECFGKLLLRKAKEP